MMTHIFSVLNPPYIIAKDLLKESFQTEGSIRRKFGTSGMNSYLLTPDMKV